MSPDRKVDAFLGSKRAVTSSTAPKPVERSTDLPVDQPKAKKWTARISMTASREMKHELEAARLDDGIEVTARLRAMITLWQEDPQLRIRIDTIARDLR